jgi:hypothetical protein
MHGDRSTRCVVGFLLPVLLLGTIAGCSPGPSAEDRSRLAEVERHFGDLYRFHLVGDGLYLEAHRTAAGEPSESEARSIFDLFWMEDGTPRSGSDYVYLNLYDHDEDFAFQLYWDPSREDVVRSSTSHY